jgi:hypothetical protein
VRTAALRAFEHIKSGVEQIPNSVWTYCLGVLRCGYIKINKVQNEQTKKHPVSQYIDVC